MTLVCINIENIAYAPKVDGTYNITIGNKYKSVDGINRTKWDDDRKTIYIIDDYDTITWYPKSCFISMDEYRQRQIDSVIK
jgi:hypothetical protein